MCDIRNVEELYMISCNDTLNHISNISIHPIQIMIDFLSYNFVVGYELSTE